MMLKISGTDQRRNNLSFLLFYGKDNFKFGEDRFDPIKSESSYQKKLIKMSWGNWGLSINYRLITSWGNLTLSPYISKAFSSDMQKNWNNTNETGEISSVTSRKPSVLQVGIREIFNFPITHNLDGEVGFHQVWYDYNIGNSLFLYSNSQTKSNVTAPPKHSKNKILSEFAQLHLNINNTIESSIGIRGNWYDSDVRNHWSVEPRFSFKIELPYQSSTSIAFSHLTQYAQQVSSNYIYLPTDAWLPTASYGKPLKSNIVSLCYFKEINHRHSLKAEVWIRDMQNVAEYNSNIFYYTDNLDWHDKIIFGKGIAYGLDLEVWGNYRSLSYRLAYGLMWNRRKFAEINSGEYYPAKYDNRHKIDVNLGWTINERLDLNVQWEYVSGNRATVALYNIATPGSIFHDSPFVNPLDPGDQRQEGIDYYEKPNNIRLPAFHRLNLNLSIRGEINEKLSYRWDIGLYNAYCHMNPFTITKSYVNLTGTDKGNYRKFKTLSLIPTLPSISYTLFF